MSKESVILFKITGRKAQSQYVEMSYGDDAVLKIGWWRCS